METIVLLTSIFSEQMYTHTHTPHHIVLFYNETAHYNVVMHFTFLFSFGIGYFGYFPISLHKEISHSFSQLHSFLLFICLIEEIHHALFD